MAIRVKGWFANRLYGGTGGRWVPAFARTRGDHPHPSLPPSRGKGESGFRPPSSRGQAFAIIQMTVMQRSPYAGIAGVASCRLRGWVGFCRCSWGVCRILTGILSAALLLSPVAMTLFRRGTILLFVCKDRFCRCGGPLDDL